MGCVSSKQAVTPAIDHSGGFPGRVGLECEKEKGSFGRKKVGGDLRYDSELSESGRSSSRGDSFSFRLGNLHKYIVGEQVAAGWPEWLTAVAGEAIQGWVPLRPEAFAILEKIGQGTYSSVFRARDIENGKIVALKKVRFYNYDRESVRFMAREIMILRRLNHPNIIKLEGLITSQLSGSVYLVFEYMEHDITGLLSCPDVKFSESQIKCYMKQLLAGIAHCHSLGVMHRDIKGSNLLVNNEGILKVADFGLANFCSSGQRQPLTSRVVTLWYRPPELLLGSTDYGASVDIWSVGCVFGELLFGKPILQGRTEVEQLHKIFKLCGSPADEYWKRSKLPHATLFKPQQPYTSCLQEAFKDLPPTALNLIETFLSVDSYKRGSASSALASEYFTTRPCACDPSSLPKYPPSKEIDAKNCEEAKRKRISGRVRGSETRKPTRKSCGSSKLAPSEDVAGQVLGPKQMNRSKVDFSKVDVTLHGQMQKASFDKREKVTHIKNASQGDVVLRGQVQKPSFDKLEDLTHVKNASQGDVPFSGPLQVSKSSGFAWAKRQKDEVSVRSHSRSIPHALDPSAALNAKNSFNSKKHESSDVMHGCFPDSKDRESYENTKRALLTQWSQFERPDSFDASDGYHSQELSLALYQKEETALKRGYLSFQDQGDKVEFSGPLLSQSNRVDGLLERHERHIRQTVRKSWFQKGKRQGR